MGLPFKPSAAKELIVNSDDSLCVALKKTVQSYYLCYQFCRYLLADDGGISENFCAQIKACAATGATSTTTTT